MSEVVEETLTNVDNNGGHIDDTMTLDNVLHIDHLARENAHQIIKQRAG